MRIDIKATITAWLTISSFLTLFFNSLNAYTQFFNLNNKEESNSANSQTLQLNTLLHGTKTNAIDRNIRSVFQDKSGTYWFGANGAGVFRHDKKGLKQFTVKDGLADNQVLSIQEDSLGNIWFGTGAFGISKFDGLKFTTYTNTNDFKITNGAASDWKSKPSDLWFSAGAGVFKYDNQSLVYLPFEQSGSNSTPPINAPFTLSRYAVYCILKDTKGNVWFGTQAQGVCRYDGKSLTWFTEKGLAGPAVLGLFEDSKGNLWFGNNGSGLYKYDSKNLVNFTTEKGLGNTDFRASGKSGLGTLARVYAINEDKSGNIWIGTVDAGVWKYDGNILKNYTTKDGLGSNAINTIFKDNVGELWFGTDSDGIFKFDGMTFTEIRIK